MPLIRDLAPAIATAALALAFGVLVGTYAPPLFNTAVACIAFQSAPTDSNAEMCFGVPVTFAVRD